MRSGGIEPSFQEPESYVRSITLQAQNNIGAFEHLITIPDAEYKFKWLGKYFSISH